VAAAPVPVKKPFPWWLVALAAGVLIIVGGVVAILSSRGDKEAPTLGQACAKEEPKCGKDLTCGLGNACVGAAGFKGCEQGAQCATNRCEAGTCEERAALEGKCDSPDDCRSPLTCHQTFCLIPMGQKCTHPSQCVSGDCQGQLCTRGAVFCLGAQDGSAGGRSTMSKQEREALRERLLGKPRPVEPDELKATDRQVSGGVVRVSPARACRLDISESGTRLRAVEVEPLAGSRVDVAYKPGGKPAVQASFENLEKSESLDVPREGAVLSLRCVRPVGNPPECSVRLR
jgi:hypothetical protein